MEWTSPTTRCLRQRNGERRKRFESLREFSTIYANYLVSTLELLWEQAVPAAQRIEELVKEEPPKA
jgi:hypothetical protein